MNADGVADALERFAERLIVKITFDVTANLIENTPVDTGFARANWLPIVGDLTFGPVGNDTGDSKSAQDSAIAALPAAYRFGETVTVGNGVSYILPLVFGSSSQAPTGWVDRAVNKAVTVDIRGIAA